jgi:hypothetical protein
MSTNFDLSKFIGSSKNLLEELYNEERGKPQQSLGYEEYLALPKTQEYIERELSKIGNITLPKTEAYIKENLNEEETKNQQAYEDRIEEKYNHIINKISNQQ